MKKILMMCVAGMMAGVAFGATETIDGMTYEYTISGGNATITKAIGNDKVVVIPSELGGATVSRIGAGAFQGNTSIVKVTIPDTVIALDGGEGKGVFSDCSALSSCNIPSGVTVMPKYCFFRCSKLRSIKLPNGVVAIEDCAFEWCSSLGAINFPDGLTSIGEKAFEGCSNLTSVWMPDSVTSVGSSCFSYCYSLETAHLSSRITVIPEKMFYSTPALKSVNIPDGVTSIGESAFDTTALLNPVFKEITVPASVISIGDVAFGGVSRVVFLGKPPEGLQGNPGIWGIVVYPREYGAQYQKYFLMDRTGGYVNPDKPVVTIVSSGVREKDPTVLDVVYKVACTKSTVKVRALAFEDGLRSFAKVTRPESFIEGTAENVGDEITANEEHTLSWRVSDDFKTDLAKMRFEVLATSEDLLPLELMTIPANGSNKAMEVSWNALSKDQFFDALMWLYAVKTEGLTLENGVLKNGTTELASGTELCVDAGNHYVAVPYVFSRMGYSVLKDDALKYANEMTRLGLVPGGTYDSIQQYAYRWIEE